MRQHRLFMLAALAGMVTAAPIAPSLAADGSKRLAVVVGNSAYENVSPLTNPANDATDIAQKLKGLGFDVLLATNAGQAKMVSLLQEFRTRLTREHVALIFFAGHGVTVNNESFLIPVDAPAEIDLDEKGDPRAEAVHRHLVSMATVLSPLEAAKIGIVFLDACRTNAAQPDLSLRVVSLKTNRAVQILRGTTSMEIKAEPLFRRSLSGIRDAARQRCIRWGRPKQSVHEGVAQAYRRQGDFDPGVDDPGAQVGDGRDREQADTLGGSGAQRELLLRLSSRRTGAGSAAVAAAFRGKLSGEERQSPSTQQCAAQCRRRRWTRIVARINEFADCRTEIAPPDSEGPCFIAGANAHRALPRPRSTRAVWRVSSSPRST